MPAPRRSQEERARSTRSALLTAAHELFAERGFANVPADEIVRRAGVTRGALYHHYADKKDLFQDVFEQLETDITSEIDQVVRAAPDPLSGMVAGLARFLDLCQRPDIRRIGLTDAPAVIGWAQWREIEARHGLGLMTQLLQQAADAGMLRVTSVPTTAQLLLSMMIEAALMIANVPGDDTVRTTVQESILGVLAGLMVPPVG